MAWGAIISGLLGAAGQIGGGLLSAEGQKVRESDIISSNYNPSLDYAMQAAQYDALNQIGWGNLNSIPGPVQQLIGQLQSAPMDAKTRRRATNALLNITQDPTLLQDTHGQGFSAEQLAAAAKNVGPGAPFGRTYLRGGGTGGTGALPVKNIGRLEQALTSAGLTVGDLQKKLQEQKDFEAKIQRFKDAGLPQLAEQMVIDRARTGAAASGIAAAGADFARTGDPNVNPFFQQLQAQDQRNLDRFSTRAGLQANFGGISQAAAQKQISDAELDQNLRVLQNALATSGLLQSTLTPGTAAVQGQSSGQLNAAQIAAQQAMAANSLRQQGGANQADSIGNAIGSATSTLGSSLGNAALMQQLNQRTVFNQGGYGPGSTANQMATNPDSSYSALFEGW